MIIKAIGIDAAFANMGFAAVEIDIDPDLPMPHIDCDQLHLVSTEKDGSKQVRVSSDRLRRSQELREALLRVSKEAEAVVAFAEIPAAPQNASAAFAFGIAIGVLASCPVPIIEVSPMEVKAAVAGKKVKKGASKAEIIEWAASRWPDAPWLRAAHAARSKNGLLPAGRLLAENEHCADALAAVVAGVQTPEFKRLVALHHHATPNPSNIRPASSQRRVRLLPL